MEIRVPVFAGRRILKKESLWDIRDYTYAGWQLYYSEYTDGLLKGCLSIEYTSNIYNTMFSFGKNIVIICVILILQRLPHYRLRPYHQEYSLKHCDDF